MIAHSCATGCCVYECMCDANQLKRTYRLSRPVKTTLHMLLQVPILYDKQMKTIVSNESADIIRMFATECQVTIIHLLPCCSSWPSNKERHAHKELSLCTLMSISCLATQSQLAPRRGPQAMHATRLSEFSVDLSGLMVANSLGSGLTYVTILLLQSRCHLPPITVLP